MTTVTDDWLKARGGLHDARIRLVQKDAAKVDLHVDDEWANERDENDVSGMGVITFHNPLELEGSIADLAGGWISEFHFEGADRLVLDMCDRDRVVVAVRFATWTSLDPSPAR